MDLLKKYGLKRIINASGTMTSLGSSRVDKNVIDAMDEVLLEFVDMRDLQKAACRVICRATGAEAGCVTACDVPVLVDAASEYDLKSFLNQGADIVLYSGHKFLGGPTSGIIAGSKELVGACYYQEKGLGRCMKAGKESIVGLMAALEQWIRRDPIRIREIEEKRTMYACDFLDKLDGFTVKPSEDPTGNPITRLKVRIDPDKSSLTAFQLTQLLKHGDPSIRVRDHHVDRDYFFISPCNLKEGEIEIICERIEELVTKPSKKVPKMHNLADLNVQSLLEWSEK